MVSVSRFDALRQPLILPYSIARSFEVYTLESVIKRHKKYRLSQHQPSQLVE